MTNSRSLSKPFNLGRWAVWTLYALLLIAAPLLFKSSLSLTMLSQAGYLVIICLSYNILLGQGGMLSKKSAQSSRKIYRQAAKTSG